MRKLLVLSLVGLLCLPALTWAEEGSASNYPAPAQKLERGVKENMVKTLKAKLEDSKEERQENRQENRANRIENYVQKITERLSNALTKMDEFMTKAGTYLTQLETRGANTADARTAEKAAKEAIMMAKGALTSLPTQIGTPANADKLTPAEVQKIRAAVKVVSESVKKAGKASQDLIKAIRAAGKTIKPAPVTPTTGTPTASPEVSQ